MSATTVLERPDGGTFQVTAGASDTGGPRFRHLIFSVPDTEDSLRLDWPDNADFRTGDPVQVSLRIGTLPPQLATMTDDTIITQDTPDEPQFGPTVEAILRALTRAFAPLVGTHRNTLHEIEGKIPKWQWDGKIGKDQRDGKIGKTPKPAVTGGVDVLPDVAVSDGGTEFATAVAQYAAAGSALGALIAATAQGAALGSAIGAAVGTVAYLTR